MLLKQHFHHKNIYTMAQWYNNLNENYGVLAIEIKGNQFFDRDNILDKFYKILEAGSITRTHIFSLNSNKPGVLRLQDDTDTEVCVQKFKKGNLTNDKRKKKDDWRTGEN